MSPHRRSRTEWREIVQRQALSGLSVSWFAARERISAQSLLWWRWRLRSDGESSVVASEVDGIATSDQLQLIPVELTRIGSSRPATRSDFELCLCADIRLRIPSGFDAHELRRLLEVLPQSG